MRLPSTCNENDGQKTSRDRVTNAKEFESVARLANGAS